MNINITKTDGTAIPQNAFVDGVVSTIRVRNLEAVDKSCIVFLACNDDKPKNTAGLTNYEGEELISEVWGSARKLGDTPWTAIGEPTYTDLFDDISVNVLRFALAANGYQDVEVKIDIPSDAESMGLLNSQLRAMAKNV